MISGPTHDITLIIGGQRFTGWTGVEVSRSLDELADTWAVQAITRWAVTTDQDLSIRIDPGDEAQFWWGEIELLRGQVDEVDGEIAAAQFSVGLAGRSRAGNLVDCSALINGAWLKRSALDIARDLVDDFGVEVLVPGAPTTPIRRFAADGDETVAETLRRLAAVAGLRVVSTPRGDVQFVAPATAPAVAQTALRYGVNIARVRRGESIAERYSDYVTRVQVPTDDDTSGAAAVISASVQDAQVTRYRPLRITAERGGTKDELVTRAEWERNTRAGRSAPVVVEVYAAERTWLAGPGVTWAPGMLVPIYVPPLGLDAQLLIQSVSLRYGEAGYGATLNLVHPEAYQPDRPPKPKKKKGGFQW